MGQEVAEFSLVTEPWIPCLLVDGTRESMGLAAVLAQSESIRRLEGELPLTNFALLRLLLAVAYGSLGDRYSDTRDWAELQELGPGALQVEEYLGDHLDRFDLLHAETPFYQVPDLHTSKHEFSGLEKLILDVPNGEPFQTTRAGQGLKTMGLAEAARWLVTTMAFDPSGIKTGAEGDDRVKGGRGYPIGIAWAGRLGGIYVEGETLWETILLNLVAPQLGETTGKATDPSGNSSSSPQQPRSSLRLWARPVRTRGQRVGCDSRLKARVPWASWSAMATVPCCRTSI